MTSIEKGTSSEKFNSPIEDMKKIIFDWVLTEKASFQFRSSLFQQHAITPAETYVYERLCTWGKRSFSKPKNPTIPRYKLRESSMSL